MTNYIITYTKTRAGAKAYQVTLTANNREEVIDLFYSQYPKYHILGGIKEN